MDPEKVNAVIEFVARGLEIIGVAVIVLAFFHAMVRAARHFSQRKEDAYDRLKIYMGRALMLGLEFLVAADIIQTVTTAPTRQGLLTLGLLIAMRIVLGWSIAVEIEGCWPWQVAAKKVSGVGCQVSGGEKQEP